MQVILLERIPGLGQMGDEVAVKPGYARNFLLPRKKALRANDNNRAVFQKQRAQLEAENLKRKDEAAKVAQKMEGLSVTLIRQSGEAGQLYGSVTARDVSEAITQAGFTIGRQQIAIDKAIKIIGIYPLPISLHPEIQLSVLVNVARSQEEADQQAAAVKAGRPLGEMPPLMKADEAPKGRKAKTEQAPEAEAAPEESEKPKKRAKKAKADKEDTAE